MTTLGPFPADATSVRTARAAVGDSLGHLPRELLDEVLLLVSELCANAVRHARSTYTVTVHSDGPVLRVEVHDTGPGSPELRPTDPDLTSGRGLHLVEALSEEWGLDTTPHRGKTVWFTVAIPLPDATGITTTADQEAPRDARRDPLAEGGDIARSPGGDAGPTDATPTFHLHPPVLVPTGRRGATRGRCFGARSPGGRAMAGRGGSGRP